MKSYGSFLIGLMIYVVLSRVEARDLAGLDMPESLSLPGGEQVLVLNGAGTVKRWFTPILVAGLYLPQRQDNAVQAMSLPGTKRVMLHILTEKITAEDLAAIWTECIENNLGAGAAPFVATHRERLLALFDNIKLGDAITIDIRPGTGSSVWVNDQYRGTLEGSEIAQAMLTVWLGDHPADVGLKRALLGG